jgi:hypothetical protein
MLLLLERDLEITKIKQVCVEDAVSACKADEEELVRPGKATATLSSFKIDDSRVAFLHRIQLRSTFSTYEKSTDCFSVNLCFLEILLEHCVFLLGYFQSSLCSRVGFRAFLFNLLVN